MRVEQTENIASPSASSKSRTTGRGWRFERHVCKRIRVNIAEALLAVDAWKNLATKSFNYNQSPTSAAATELAILIASAASASARFAAISRARSASWDWHTKRFIIFVDG
jgi:hypothetical protein